MSCQFVITLEPMMTKYKTRCICWLYYLYNTLKLCY